MKLVRSGSGIEADRACQPHSVRNSHAEAATGSRAPHDDAAALSHEGHREPVGPGGDRGRGRQVQVVCARRVAEPLRVRLAYRARGGDAHAGHEDQPGERGQQWPGASHGG
jgi:hypothetical protein